MMDVQKTTCRLEHPSFSFWRGRQWSELFLSSENTTNKQKTQTVNEPFKTRHGEAALEPLRVQLLLICHREETRGIIESTFSFRRSHVRLRLTVLLPPAHRSITSLSPCPSHRSSGHSWPGRVGGGGKDRGAQKNWLLLILPRQPSQ